MKELWGYSKIKPLGRGRGGFHKKVKKKKKKKIQAQGGAAKKVMSLFKNVYVLFFLQFNFCYSKSHEALIILQ